MKLSSVDLNNVSLQETVLKVGVNYFSIKVRAYLGAHDIDLFRV